MLVFAHDACVRAQFFATAGWDIHVALRAAEFSRGDDSARVRPSLQKVVALAASPSAYPRLPISLLDHRATV
jgi:hypothetical protein